MKKSPLASGLLPLVLITAFGSSQAFAADDISVSVTSDYVTEYVFRGVTLAGEAIQPGAEISSPAFGGNFTAGVWASVAIGEESVSFGDEIDIYAGYAFDVSESVSADIGVTLYHYPQLGGLLDIGANDAGTVEVYGSLSFTAPLAPSVTAYYDFTLEAFTLEGSAEHSFPVSAKTSFDVSASAGMITVSGAGDYQYGSLSGALSYGYDDNTSVYAGINGGVSSQNTFGDINFDIGNFATISAPSKSSIWFGVGIAAGF